MTNDASHIEAVDAGAHDAHDSHGDDHGGGHGHGADPNAGVVVGEPPTPAWVMTATLIALLTVVGCVLLAVKIG